MLAVDKGSFAVNVIVDAYAAPVAPFSGLIAGDAAKVGEVVSIVPEGPALVPPPPPPPHAVNRASVTAGIPGARLEFGLILF